MNGDWVFPASEELSDNSERSFRQETEGKIKRQEKIGYRLWAVGCREKAEGSCKSSVLSCQFPIPNLKLGARNCCYSTLDVPRLSERPRKSNVSPYSLLRIRSLPALRLFVRTS